MGRRLLAIVVLAAVSGCGNGDADHAAATALRACEAVEPGVALTVSAGVPTEAELAGSLAAASKAADLAAKAALRDRTWDDLSKAYSAYADAGESAVSLWRRIRSVSLVAYVDGTPLELENRMHQAGVSESDITRVRRDLDASARDIRTGCRKVRAATPALG